MISSLSLFTTWQFYNAVCFASLKLNFPHLASSFFPGHFLRAEQSVSSEQRKAAWNLFILQTDLCTNPRHTHRLCSGPSLHIYAQYSPTQEEKSGPSRAHLNKRLQWGEYSNWIKLYQLLLNQYISASSATQQSSANKRHNIIFCFRNSQGGFGAGDSHLFAGKVLWAGALQSHGREGEMQFLIMRIITLNYLAFISNLN